MPSSSLSTLSHPVYQSFFRNGRRRLLGGVPFACRFLSESANDSSTLPSATRERSWTWSTPSPLRPGRTAPVIPIKPRVNLTVKEVVHGLETQGALDVRVIDLKGKGTGLGDAMVLSTATTPLHMRRLADTIVYALKKRKLRNAMGFTGAEGYDCDDWMLVDCDNMIVHMMMEEKRKELDLESFWSHMVSSAFSALEKKRARGEPGLVEDNVDWEEDFGEEEAKAFSSSSSAAPTVSREQGAEGADGVDGKQEAS